MSSITIKTISGQEFVLTPVPMPRIPSDRAVDWLVFQGAHLSGSLLSDSEQNRIQAFMRKHKTEALNNGDRNLTLAGGFLALCYPHNVK